MSEYNGHRNWNAWNVSLWINNTEWLYELAKDCIRAQNTRKEAATLMLLCLQEIGVTHTPDGAPYCVTNIMHSMVGY